MARDKVDLVVDGHRLNASRSHLSRVSPYFAAMFGEGFAESASDSVELHDVDFEAVRNIVEFSLGAAIKLTEQNVFGVVQAAGMLRFEAALDHARKFVRASMRVGNVLRIYVLSDLHSEAELACAAKKLLLWRLEEATNVPFLSDVPAECLLEILGDSRANVRSESVIVAIIKRWMSFGDIEEDNAERRASLPRLLKCVRLDQLAPNEIESLSKWGASKNLPDQSLADLCPAASRRRPPTFPCVVGRMRDKDDLFYVFAFDLEAQRPRPLAPLIHAFNGDVKAVGFQVCAVGTTMYVIGGENAYGRGSWNEKVWAYDTLEEQWTEVADLGQPRRHHRVCLSDDGQLVYVVGGFGRHRIMQSSVFAIELSPAAVRPLPDLPCALYSAAACCFRGKLYVFRSSVLVFDAESAAWTELAGVELPKTLDFSQAMATSSHIFLTSTTARDIYCFDPVSGSPLERVGSFENEAQNICLLDGVIYNFFTDEFDGNSRIESFDTENKTARTLWESRGDEAFEFSSRYSFGCFNLVIY